MQVLLINAYGSRPQGDMLFENYSKTVKKLLGDTVGYGNEIQWMIRDKDNLADLIYDQASFRCEEKARYRFRSIEYVFIDGNTSIAPWAESYSDVLLFIRICIKEHKKIHCNGFAHYASYFYLTTDFNHHCSIHTKGSKNLKEQNDYYFDQSNGFLYAGVQKVCHSGIYVTNNGVGLFSTRSSQAMKQGAILDTKYHVVAFDSKSGNPMLKNIHFPFSLFWRSRIFCAPKADCRSKAEVLVETDNHLPLAFTFRKEFLSTQTLCPQFLAIIQNWLAISVGKDCLERSLKHQYYSAVALDNKSSKWKLKGELASKALSQISTIKLRPVSSSFSRLQYEKPSIRCSGGYKTMLECLREQQRIKKRKMLGKARMVFGGSLQDYQVQNYVVKAPSRPPSAHNFREVQKSKWVSKKTFFLS